MKKGTHLSDSAKEKLRQSHKGRHLSPSTEFKKGQIPLNKIMLSDGSFYPSIPSLCECLDINCNEITYNGNKYILGHSRKGKITIINKNPFFIPTLCECRGRNGCGEIVKSTEKIYAIGHYARVKHPRNRLGCKSTIETIEKLRIANGGENNNMFGIPPSPMCNRAHGDWYDTPLQGTKFLRSQWEIKYAKYLDQNHILWMYEMETFPIILVGKNRTYTPDFFLIKEERFIDVKGNPEGNADKIQQFREEYPFDLDVLFEDDLKKLSINLKTKEPKYIFKNKQQEEELLKQME